MRRLTAIIFLLLVSFTACGALACLWDDDTVRDERGGLPGVAEVLAGRWEKHSRYFYEQRIVRMGAVIARDPADMAAYDNLAVAYEKIDDRDRAIDVMLKKEARQPGLYTTYANLGTFYFHKGDFDRGALFIRKALAVNPDAHFGREEYQLKLAEYLRDPDRRADANFLGFSLRDLAFKTPQTLPTTVPDERRERAGARNDEEEAELLGSAVLVGSPDRPWQLGLKANVFDGIVGLLRFGPGMSAELYLTLGDLLTLRGDKNLAYRAYLRAQDLGHPRAQYLRAVMAALKDAMESKADVEPATIAQERADAAAWVEAYRKFEDDLVRRGIDTDDAKVYAAFYREHGAAVPGEQFKAGDLLPRERNARLMTMVGIAVGTVVAAVAVLLFLTARLYRRWRRKGAAVRAG